jgi:Plavaka transposase
MVSVATGHVEYHPLYLSIGLVHNTVRRAHRNSVIPIGFLAIPKGTIRLVAHKGASELSTSRQKIRR